MATTTRGPALPHHEGCARQALLRGDPMPGTAFPARRVLMIQQPGPWGREGLRDSSFDRTLACAIEALANAQDTRVLAVRRPGRNPSPSRRIWILADTDPAEDGMPHRRATVRTGDFGTDGELLAQMPEILSGQTPGWIDEPLYVVCAHSKHDVCCAVGGRQLAAALHLRRPGRVWESTHLGGERFAPNLLVLPAGILYGRVGLDEVERVVDAADRGAVLHHRLRGRVGMPPAAQAAFAHLLHHLPGVDADQLRLTGSAPTRDGRATVQFDIGSFRAHVALSVDEVSVDGITCSKPGPGTYLHYRPLAWQFSRAGEDITVQTSGVCS